MSEYMENGQGLQTYPHRQHTRTVQIGGVCIGGGAPVVIQSMTNTSVFFIDPVLTNPRGKNRMFHIQEKYAARLQGSTYFLKNLFNVLNIMQGQIGNNTVPLIFRLKSIPRTRIAPLSAANLQCQPYPHPRSRTCFPSSGGNNRLS